jgi:hypothetical protein
MPEVFTVTITTSATTSHVATTATSHIATTTANSNNFGTTTNDSNALELKFVNCIPTMPLASRTLVGPTLGKPLLSEQVGL